MSKWYYYKSAIENIHNATPSLLESISGQENEGSHPIVAEVNLKLSEVDELLNRYAQLEKEGKKELLKDTEAQMMTLLEWWNQTFSKYI